MVRGVQALAAMRNVLLLVGVLALTACAADVEPEAQDDQAELSAPIANFKTVRPGLYRGGHPDSKGIDYLKKLGVKTIVDLEVGDFIEATPWSISDELDQAAKAKITVLRFPMSAFEAAESDRFDRQMDDILAVLGDAAKKPLYVHCKHGQDRTGLVIGLERVFVEGWTPKAAHDEMVKLGFHTGFVGLDSYFAKKTASAN